MKKVFPRFFVCLITISFLSLPAIVLADGVCADMKIVNVGISPSSPSGVAVWLQNITDAACGSISPGDVAQFNVSTTNTDRTLAVALTAASSKKNVWIYYAGIEAPYTIAYLVAGNFAE